MPEEVIDTIKTNTNNTLSASIANAMKTHEGEVVQDGDNKQSNPKKAAPASIELDDPSKEEDENDGEEVEGEENDNDTDDGEEGDDLTEEEQLKARQLFKALKDPQQQGAIIEFLANRAGYKKVDTPQEAKEAKKDVKEELKAALGEEFDFLTDKLGPAIDKIINDRLEAATKPLADRQAKAEELRFQEEANAAITSISKVYYNGEEIPQEVTAEMTRVMERVKPTAEMSTKQYLEDIYFIASGRVSGKKGKTNPDLAKRVASNRSNAPSRLQTDKKPSPGVQTGDGKMSLTDAIKNAVDSVNGSVQ